jgi:glycine/D-amino acid oxidase-like deaminating enzyme
LTRHESLWIATGPEQPEHPPLERDTRAEVVVIGGGIVGITTALLLADAGVEVVLIEAGRLACGVSAHTTAKVSSQHGLVYAALASRFGADAARAYGRANEAGLEWIAARAEGGAIDCDFRRRPRVRVRDVRVAALPDR